MNPNRHVTLVAHRGGSQLAPENTMAAFKIGLEMGADALECDVHLSSDGVPVVIHDAKLERTTNGTGEAGDHTLEQLQSLRIAETYTYPTPVDWDRLRIPTLEELVAFAAPAQIQLYIEIKNRADRTRYPQIEERVIETLRRNAMLKRSTIICFDFDTLRRCKELEPSLLTSALIWRGGIGNRLKDDGSLPCEMIVDEIKSTGAESSGVSSEYLSPELTDALHQGGLGVSVWTVNDLALMHSFLAMGVDSLTSDRPDLFKELRQK